MNSLKIFSTLFKIFLLVSFLFSLNQCGIYKKTDAREVPTNAKERARKNMEEGKSIKLFKGGLGGSGTFQFASSNEMWRATIEILDFIPLTSANYGGGLIITDWYNDTDNKNESIKIMVQFLSNEVRADGLKVVVYDKICAEQSLNNCQTKVNKSTVSEEIKLAILKRASEIKNEKIKKNVEEYKKKRKDPPKAYRTQ